MRGRTYIGSDASDASSFNEGVDNRNGCPSGLPLTLATLNSETM